MERVINILLPLALRHTSQMWRSDESLPSAVPPVKATLRIAGLTLILLVLFIFATVRLLLAAETFLTSTYVEGPFIVNAIYGLITLGIIIGLIVATREQDESTSQAKTPRKVPREENQETTRGSIDTDALAEVALEFLKGIHDGYHRSSEASSSSHVTHPKAQQTSTPPI